MLFEFKTLLPIFPEMFLSFMALMMLLVGVFMKNNNEQKIGWIVAIIMFITFCMVLNVNRERITAFNGLFVSDSFSIFTKLMVLASSVMSLVLAQDWFKRKVFRRFEYPILLMLSAVGMMVMISANNLMTAYLGLELQSLPLYLMASYKKAGVKSSEAGAKLFILNIISSCIFLYGASLVYGFSGGMTGFDELSKLFASGFSVHLGLSAGVIFIVAGMAFKVAAVPFHMWAPDVFEGAPIPASAFFSVAPIIAAMSLFIRILTGPFASLSDCWQPLLIFLSAASMIVSSIATIKQTNIKRLMAYCIIFYTGYALIGLAVGGKEGIAGTLIFMFIYLFINIGLFSVIVSMHKDNLLSEDIERLLGLSGKNPVLSFVFALLLLSMAGVPPLAGFFGRFYLLGVAVDAGMYGLAIIGVLSSIVFAFSCIRIIGFMYFEEPDEGFDEIGNPIRIVLSVVMIPVVLLFLNLSPLLIITAKVADSLYVQ